MPVIEIKTRIAAPIEIVFDLARSIDLHMDSTAPTRERAVAGRISGLIEKGETVTWEASHFGFRLKHSSEIPALDRPRYFRDSMIEGIFKRFDHDHEFEETEGATLMVDRLDYDAPLGFLGRIADFLFLERYLKRFLIRRNAKIVEVAESGDFSRYLDGADSPPGDAEEVGKS